MVTNLWMVVQAGVKAVAIATAIKEAQSDGQLTDDEMVVVYNKINDLFRSLGLNFLPHHALPEQPEIENLGSSIDDRAAKIESELLPVNS